THGFPPDLTEQMAQERGLKIDFPVYKQLMQEHEEISRGKESGSAGTGGAHFGGSAEGWRATNDSLKWSGGQCEATIIGWATENQAPTYFDKTSADQKAVPGDRKVALMCDQTCFYAEAGGQIGDKGTISTPTGVFQVSEVSKVGNSILHIGQVSAGTIELGQT